MPSLNNNFLSPEGVGAFFALIQRNLIKNSILQDAKRINDFIFTPTDYYWSLHPSTIPFARLPEKVDNNLTKLNYIVEQLDNQTLTDLTSSITKVDQELMNILLSSSEEDAVASFFLAFPFMSNDSVIHDIGCWNGQNLINLLYYGHFRGSCCFKALGTDINNTVLNIAEATCETIGINSSDIQFHLSNALDHIDLEQLGFSSRTSIKLALRLLPVLDKFSAQNFLRTLYDSMNNSSVCILSYALPEGKLFDKNNNLFKQAQRYKEEFDGGVTFRASFPVTSSLPKFLENMDKKIITNTYYTKKGFDKLISSNSFTIINSIEVVRYSDNYRLVNLIKKD